MSELRRRAREAAPAADRWYPACWSRSLRRGAVRPVVLWGQRFAVFRDAAGALHAVRDRCAHRPVPLSEGHVRGCELVCPYHGWSYDGSGTLVSVPHSLFGRSRPRLSVPSFSVRERYGLVWLFPGSRARAATVPLPSAPELEDPHDWPRVGLDARWGAHHSAVIDNVLDLSHEHLHRRFAPFLDVELEGFEREGDTVTATYGAAVAAHAFLRPFVPPHRGRVEMIMRYAYPHHDAAIGGFARNFQFLRPIDASSTHVYVLFAARAATFPGMRSSVPRPVVRAGLRALRRFYLRPLLEEDRAVLESEQRGEDGGPVPELNPVVRACHELTARMNPVARRSA